MSTGGLLLAAIAFLNLAIGLLVYSRNRAAPLNRAFAFTASAVACWTAALAWGRFQPESFETAIRSAFASASFGPIGILFFTEYFGADTPAHRNRLRLLALAGATFSALSLTSPWMVSEVVREPYGMRPLYGPLHPFFAGYLILCFGLAAVGLVHKYRSCTGLQRTQIAHVFVALVVPGVLAATTNVFVPLAAGTSAYNGLGPVFSLIMILVVAHAIIRHRLMDIRIVIRRGAVYLVTVLSSAAIFVLLLFGSNFVLPREHGFSVRDVLLALIVAILFQSVKAYVQELFDRYLYRDPYDYASTLREASHVFTSTIELPTLLNHTAKVLTTVLRAETVTIYLLDLEDQEFRDIDE